MCSSVAILKPAHLLLANLATPAWRCCVQIYWLSNAMTKCYEYDFAWKIRIAALDHLIFSGRVSSAGRPMEATFFSSYRDLYSRFSFLDNNCCCFNAEDKKDFLSYFARHWDSISREAGEAAAWDRTSADGDYNLLSVSQSHPSSHSNVISILCCTERNKRRKTI